MIIRKYECACIYRKQNTDVRVSWLSILLVKDRWKYIFIYSDSLWMDCYVLLLYI